MIKERKIQLDKNMESHFKKLVRTDEKIHAQSLIKIKELEKKCVDLSELLIKKEQENLKLMLDNKKLNNKLQKLTKTYNNLKCSLEKIGKNYTNISNGNNIGVDKFLENKDNKIKSLQSEIKKMNKRHSNALAALSQKGGSSLMREKAKNINLNNKVRELQKHIAAIEENLGKAEAAHLPLRTEIKKQKAIIDKFVTWEQVKSFIDHAVKGENNTSSV